MTNKTTKNITSLEDQRRELDRQIRAAKRAEKKAAENALLSSRQCMGVDLAKAVGADNVEAVRLLAGVLMSGQMQQFLREQIWVDSSEGDGTDAHVEDGDESEHHDLVD